MAKPARSGRRPVVVLTGASSGIGRASAGLFARNGWDVGIIARDPEGLSAARQDIAVDDARVAIAIADVADADALDLAAGTIETELGPIDVWVNVAGISFYAPFLMMSEEEFRRITDVTYLGVVHGTRCALSRMQARDHGVIVNIGSALSHRGLPLQTAYSAAKYAVRGFTEAVRSELIHDRSQVRIILVNPPSVNTPFFSHAGIGALEGRRRVPRPVPPVYQPELIAEAVYFAATHRRREIQVTGVSLGTALLNRFAPGLADQLAGRYGVAAQLTAEPSIRALQDVAVFDRPRRPSGTHGPFDREARRRSAYFWIEKNRPALVIGLAMVGAVTVAGLLRPTLFGRGRAAMRLVGRAIGR